MINIFFYQMNSCQENITKDKSTFIRTYKNKSNLNKKNILKNLFLIIFSVVITLIFIEYFLKKNPTIFPNMGWQGKNLLQDQINNCDQNKKSIGVFGDSFVEFYGKSKINLVNMLNTKSNNYFCNFGLSGIDINDYINRQVKFLLKIYIFNL